MDIFNPGYTDIEMAGVVMGRIKEEIGAQESTIERLKDEIAQRVSAVQNLMAEFRRWERIYYEVGVMTDEMREEGALY